MSHDHEVTLPEAEKFTDQNDRASDIEDRAREQAVYDTRKNAKRTQEPDEHGKYLVLECVDCGEEIGEGRLRVSIKNTLCIYCAEASERRR